MPKKKQNSKPKQGRKSKKKAIGTRPAKRKIVAQAVSAVRTVAAAPDPTGSCRYADSSGNMQCESPVTKSYCDGKSGFFTEDGRCN